MPDLTLTPELISDLKAACAAVIDAHEAMPLDQNTSKQTSDAQMHALDVLERHLGRESYLWDRVVLLLIDELQAEKREKLHWMSLTAKRIDELEQLREQRDAARHVISTQNTWQAHHSSCSVCHANVPCSDEYPSLKAYSDAVRAYDALTEQEASDE